MRPRFAGALAFALALAVALAAYMWATALVAQGDDAESSRASETGEVVHVQESGETDNEETTELGVDAAATDVSEAEGAEDVEGAASELFFDLARDASSASSISSSSEDFMDDLGRQPPQTGEGRASAAWSASQSLPALAAEVLHAYEKAGSCELVTSGYMDLRGNAWGAVVRDERGWVDVVAIYADEDDDTSHARVVRLWGEADEDGGS